MSILYPYVPIPRPHAPGETCAASRQSALLAPHTDKPPVDCGRRAPWRHAAAPVPEATPHGCCMDGCGAASDHTTASTPALQVARNGLEGPHEDTARITVGQEALWSKGDFGTSRRFSTLQVPRQTPCEDAAVALALTWTQQCAHTSGEPSSARAPRPGGAAQVASHASRRGAPNTRL